MTTRIIHFDETELLIHVPNALNRIKDMIDKAVQERPEGHVFMFDIVFETRLLLIKYNIEPYTSRQYKHPYLKALVRIAEMRSAANESMMYKYRYDLKTCVSWILGLLDTAHRTIGMQFMTEAEFNALIESLGDHDGK